MRYTDNYLIQVNQAKARFLTYDQNALIAKFGLKHDDAYLYMDLLRQVYRLNRKNGDIDRLRTDQWVDANSYEEVMTLLDLLCDSREDRYITGRWKNMQAFGMQFHQSLLEDQRSVWADRFDKKPDSLHRACRALDGEPVHGADISYRIEFFDGLPICLQFWHGDEEFAPRLRYLWDENADRYLRYETMFFAVTLLLRRLEEETE